MGTKYSSLKILHFRDKVESLLGDEILPPIHIRIKPTNRCNHNCWYCAYRSDNLQLGKDMVVADYIPKQKMMEIIESVAGMGVRAVTFSGGGEPLCYPYIKDALIELSQTPVKFAALTNGALLKGEVAEIFAHAGSWVRISVDGWDDESYTFYRGVPDYTKIMRNIEDFSKLGGDCFLGVSIIIDHKNASHVYDSIRQYKDVGVKNVKLSPCIVSNDGAENNTYHNAIYEKVRGQAERAIEDMADEEFEIFDSYHRLGEKFKKNYTWCPYIQVLTVIGADQNVYSCQDKAYNLDEGLIGSIKNMRFDDFWFSAKDKFFKINPSVICNHHCLSNERNNLVLDYLGVDRGHLEFV